MFRLAVTTPKRRDAPHLDEENLEARAAATSVCASAVHKRACSCLYTCQGSARGHGAAVLSRHVSGCTSLRMMSGHVHCSVTRSSPFYRARSNIIHSAHCGGSPDYISTKLQLEDGCLPKTRPAVAFPPFWPASKTIYIWPAPLFMRRRHRNACLHTIQEGRWVSYSPLVLLPLVHAKTTPPMPNTTMRRRANKKAKWEDRIGTGKTGQPIPHICRIIP
ncbi:hypothetical protein B0T24DRAFT_161740 [Lasiosphaeria ovina]|uniref:Uncharacterized protein n=1 Tax=Lasiosphaeria ovina TaxID=92902 RepID=A0AAE0KP38_9PEZI|nr:hypothetical protein B0T24DRAFT_161740 [Lasiosphaeria ovina]